MTQIDVETTIPVMTTRDQMRNRNDSNISAIDKKEEHSTAVIIAFVEDSSDDLIRSLQLDLHLSIDST
jgi:hypothetical protein